MFAVDKALHQSAINLHEIGHGIDHVLGIGLIQFIDPGDLLQIDQDKIGVFLFDLIAHHQTVDQQHALVDQIAGGENDPAAVILQRHQNRGPDIGGINRTLRPCRDNRIWPQVHQLHIGIGQARTCQGGQNRKMDRRIERTGDTATTQVGNAFNT